MANPEHMAVLKHGVAEWNAWRIMYTDAQTDLSGADLSKRDLRECYLRDADLRSANLSGCSLVQATLTNTNLAHADLTGAILNRSVLLGANAPGARFCAAKMRDAKMQGINLEGAQMQRTDLVHSRITAARCSFASFAEANLQATALNKTDFTGAIFMGADLSNASINETCFAGAKLDGARIYGISVWDVDLADATQNELVITRKDDTPISVDNLEVAQFIYLLLNNAKIRHVVDAITSKVVLILGRFTNERKTVLDALRTILRERDYLPVLFDFQGPSSRDITETISILAHMARFVIADITDAKSIPQELMTIVPNLPSVPVQPLLLESQREYGMFEHFKRYPWVLPMTLYGSQEELLKSLEQRVIVLAEAKVKELRGE